MADEKRTADEERDSYREGYEQDAQAWRTRIQELEDLGHTDGSPVYDQAKQGLENALDALKKQGAKRESRPARARETRKKK